MSAAPAAAVTVSIFSRYLRWHGVLAAFHASFFSHGYVWFVFAAEAVHKAIAARINFAILTVHPAGVGQHQQMTNI